MGYNVNKPVPFVPVKDVSNVLIPGQAVGVSMDGNYLYSWQGGPIAQLYDLAHDHIATLKQPFSNSTPYRNSIFPITGDINTPRVTGTLGPRSPFGQYWDIATVDNGKQHGIGVQWLDYNTETPQIPFNYGGQFNYIVPVANTNDGSIVVGELTAPGDPLLLGWGPFYPYEKFWNSVSGFSYPLVLSARTANLGGTHDMAFIVRNAGTNTQECNNIAGPDSYTDFNGSGPEQFGLAQSISAFSTPFSASAQPFSDVGNQRNYNFQIFEGLLFIGCVGDNGAGTLINPVTGFTDLAGTSQNPPFVFALGDAIVMEAAFPPSFSIGATNYSGPSVLRCLTMMGCDLYAVVNYALPDPGGLGHGSHVLMQLGYFLTLNISAHSGTYNWKRSLTYGIGNYTIQNGQVVFNKGNG